MYQDSFSFSEKYNGFITNNQNYVWGGAMCLAWNELKTSIIKSPVKLKTDNKLALHMIENFNAERFLQSDINPADIYIKSGYGQKTLDQINVQVKQKFPEKTTPPLDIKMEDTSFIAYAYLLKKLNFLNKFTRYPAMCFQFRNQKVEAFYAENKQQKKQIQYCQYNGRDNFTIAIRSENPKDLLFLVKSQNYHLKVEEVFEKCREQNLIRIGNDDQFTMPIVQLDLFHSIDELKLKVLNEGFQSYEIQQIFQSIKLKIDESGAKVQNQAVIVGMLTCAGFSHVKQFILDGPFWIVMKEVGKHPYLAVYIKNPVQKK